MMTVTIIPNDTNNPPGKLADAELHFTACPSCADPTKQGIYSDADCTCGPLVGLKLIGFSVWERTGGRNVTFPARQYSVNGERRGFSLLRPIMDATAQDRIREVILEAYAEHEEKSILDASEITIMKGEVG